MASNGGGGGTSRDSEAASIMAAAASAVGSAESRFPSHLERRHRWRSGGGGCWSGFSCFGSEKRTKRIVPSSRIPDGTVTATSANRSRPAGLPNQTPVSAPSLLAPPSSPASSLANSALHSTAQSPKNCFLLLSTNSPEDPSSTMFAIGPYAHETQLVSPPVFSAFTTEPSTAPFTPPPGSAHITTPSSPDVPYARYLSSSMDFRNVGRGNGTMVGNDLQATYPLCPGSPSSSLISPASGTPRTGMSSPFPESEPPSRDVPYSTNGSSQLFASDASSSKSFMLALDSSFFCPASSAQFHLDQAQRFSFSRSSGGRLSISREGDNYPNCGYRHNKSGKQDVEELEAYRASFGFSADEIITTPSYDEACDEVDISFTVSTSTNNTKPSSHQYPASRMIRKEEKEITHLDLLDPKKSLLISNHDLSEVDHEAVEHSDSHTGAKRPLCSGDASCSNGHHASADDMIFPKTLNAEGRKSFHSGFSSDAEIDYRRSRSSKVPSTMTFCRRRPRSKSSNLWILSKRQDLVQDVVQNLYDMRATCSK